MDNLLLVENILSNKQCDELIDKFSTNLNYLELDSHLNYGFYDAVNGSCSVLDELKINLVERYKEKFPAINMTNDKWTVESWRFKHFPPNYCFKDWHQEHTTKYSFAIAAILVYLSNHDCGTEFYATGEVIKSRKGRAIMFPAFWTHTHRGQLCPDQKDRYIMSAYINLLG